jgi:prepilin-type N-terminal cleavage/methylation domain-containing protein/prepilin-type processing-associated H-X9-DG protein
MKSQPTTKRFTFQLSGRRHRQPRALSGVTLIELLVVIAVVGVLIGFAIPAVQAAREAARRTNCSNNVRQVGIALDLHHQQYGSYPLDAEQGYGISAFLLPFLDEKDLYDRLDPKNTRLPDLGHAREGLEDTVLEIFLCPSAKTEILRLPITGFARSNYLGTTNLFSFRATYEFVRDGESNTIAVGEILTEHAWALPKTGTGEIPPNGGGDFASGHPGGAQFVFCDASVHFINDDIDPALFRALCTIDQGDPVSEF